jgi:hypothetical protein
MLSEVALIMQNHTNRRGKLPLKLFVSCRSSYSLTPSQLPQMC